MGQTGLGLFANGYNDKILALVKLAIDKIATFAKDLEAEERHQTEGQKVKQDQETETEQQQRQQTAEINNNNNKNNEKNVGNKMKNKECESETIESESENNENENDQEESRAAMFVRLREALRKEYKSRMFNDPISHAGNCTSACLMSRQWTDQEYLEVVEGQSGTRKDGGGEGDN